MEWAGDSAFVHGLHTCVSHILYSFRLSSVKERTGLYSCHNSFHSSSSAALLLFSLSSPNRPPLPPRGLRKERAGVKYEEAEGGGENDEEGEHKYGSEVGREVKDEE